MGVVSLFTGKWPFVRQSSRLMEKWPKEFATRETTGAVLADSSPYKGKTMEPKLLAHFWVKGSL